MISRLNKVLPCVGTNPKNWKEVDVLVGHAKVLVKETDLSIVGREDLLRKIGSYYFHIVFDYKEAISYWAQELDLLKLIHTGNHPKVANSLNNVGLAYKALGGEENLKMSLKCQEDALQMYQEVFPGNHPKVASSLKNVGSAYKALGGKENILKGLKYLEASLKMRKALFNGDYAEISNSLNSIGSAYKALGGEENIRKGLKFQEECFRIYPRKHPKVAKVLHNIGIT